MSRPGKYSPCFRDGVPGYVFGWCCKAEAKTMQRGYRDVGYLLMPRAPTFRPPSVCRKAWRKRVVLLWDSCLANDARHVWEWRLNHYPTLARHIPRESRGDFVAGMVERVWSD